MPFCPTPLRPAAPLCAASPRPARDMSGFWIRSVGKEVLRRLGRDSSIIRPRRTKNRLSSIIGVGRTKNPPSSTASAGRAQNQPLLLLLPTPLTNSAGSLEGRSTDRSSSSKVGSKIEIGSLLFVLVNWCPCSRFGLHRI